jgi:hypothetical protein
MAESKSDYEVGPGRPPLHTRFKKGLSGTPAAAPGPACSRAPTRSSRNSYFRPPPSAAHARAGNEPLAGPQNQTRRAVRALIRLGCRCASRECGLTFLYGYLW